MYGLDRVMRVRKRFSHHKVNFFFFFLFINFVEGENCIYSDNETSYHLHVASEALVNPTVEIV